MSNTSETQLVAVVGASGGTGTAVLGALQRAGLASRALVHRDEQRGAALRAGATDTRVVELNDPESVATALDGATAVHYIPPVFTPNETDQVAGTVDAAERLGIARFVFHSVMHPATPGVRHHLRKSASEFVVRRSSLKWTILQPAMYAQTVNRYRLRSEPGTIAIPYSLDTPFTPIDLDDVAEISAAVLAGGDHQSATYEIAGKERLTTREMIELAGAANSTVLAAVQADFADAKLPASWTESARADMAAMCEHYTRVGFCGGWQVAAMLLGREPTPFRRAIRLPDAE